ncbi:hypothetical protein BU15DRAFT_83508 [Melanogaster broomeanus]|nr:hypothetical protein BU15DRAFT_83508 [Melanogaster broomeanus]
MKKQSQRRMVAPCSEPVQVLNVPELTIPLILSLLRHGWFLKCCHYSSDHLGQCFRHVTALHKYGASVKNAGKSCQRLVEEIQLINALANIVEASARKLSTNTAPDSFCWYWIDDKSPAMLYKSELDKLMERLSQKQDVSRVKRVLWRLGWPAKESEIKATIESLERCTKHLDLVVALKNADALNAISKQGEEQRALLKGKSVRFLACHFLMTSITDVELQELYNWMDTVNCTTRYEITLGKRQDETCKWLLDSKRYSDWFSSETHTSGCVESVSLMYLSPLRLPARCLRVVDIPA